MKRDIINQVRELLERQFDVITIAHKIRVDIRTVKLAANIIKGIVT
jgi:hypothetical protein